MLRQRKSLYLSRLILGQQLRTKSGPGRRYGVRDDDDDDKYERIRKKRERETQEGYIHLQKSRGQHLLTNPRILDAIVRKSYIKPTDTILEIGPGTGNLTLKLLEVAEKVVAVEIDKRMIEILSKRATERGFRDRLTIICKDALKTEFPQFDLVVANIPYGISSPLVAKLVFGATQFRSATLLLQKEFAHRLLANPGDSDFNRLAVNVKLVAEADFVMDVSKGDFVPVPKVDSSVVIIRPKSNIPDVNLYEWLAFTRTCFSKKNKTLGATLKQKKKVMELFKISKGMSSEEEKNTVLDCSDDEDEEEEGVSDEGDCYSPPYLETGNNFFRDKIVKVLNSGGFEDKRPSKLSNDELLNLLSLFNKDGIYFHDHSKKPSEAGDEAFASYGP